MMDALRRSVSVTRSSFIHAARDLVAALLIGPFFAALFALIPLLDIRSDLQDHIIFHKQHMSIEHLLWPALFFAVLVGTVGWSGSGFGTAMVLMATLVVLTKPSYRIAQEHDGAWDVLPGLRTCSSGRPDVLQGALQPPYRNVLDLVHVLSGALTESGPQPLVRGDLLVPRPFEPHKGPCPAVRGPALPHIGPALCSCSPRPVRALRTATSIGRPHRTFDPAPYTGAADRTQRLATFGKPDPRPSREGPHPALHGLAPCAGRPWHIHCTPRPDAPLHVIHV